MASTAIKASLSDLILCTSDKIGILNIAQIILHLGQLTHLICMKALFGKGFDGNETIYLSNHMENKNI